MERGSEHANVSLPALLISYICGNVIAHYIRLPIWFILAGIVSSLVASVLVALKRRRLPMLQIYICLCLLLIFTGVARCLFVKNIKAPYSKKSSFELKLEKSVEGPRRTIQESVGKFLDKDQAGLIMGILLGDTTNISQQTKDDFQRTGLTHILAVSGMNVGVLVLASLFVLKFVPAGQLLKFPLIATFVIWYALLTQLQPSVIRASIMAIAGLGAYLLGRRQSLLNSLSVAALALLLYDPLMLYSISFQLSFAATLAIILFVPVLHDSFSFLPGIIRNGLSVCLAAQLGVTPLLVYYFGQFSSISLLANLLVVPATYPVMIIGMIMIPVFALSGSLVKILSTLSGVLLSYIMFASHFLASLPLSSFSLSAPSIFVMCLYYVVLGLLFLKIRRGHKKTNLALVLIVALSFLVMFVGCEVTKSGPPAKLTVTFIDVGQGDATLIRTPEGQAVLVDGGPSGSAVNTFLNNQAVRKIDLLILSHPHADHVGGLATVVLSHQVGMVLDVGVPHPSRTYRDFLKAVQTRQVSYKLARSEQVFALGPKLKVEVLAPDDKTVAGEKNLNNTSVVVKIRYGKFKLLLPGDLEKAKEKALVYAGVDLNATVLKVPHHGSSNGSDASFIKAVHPEVAVISVGENDFGHPAKSTIKKLTSIGAEVYRTDLNGHVTILSDGDTFEVRTQK